jgi:Zn-dependent protease
VRVLGFPVTIRVGFLAFLALAIVLNPQPFGWWLAGSIAVLTLVHELGHAVAARRAGARAEIALDMLAGYTTYHSTAPLTPGHRALIAVSGPTAEIVVGVVALLLLGANPLSRSSIEASDARLAIWWAGPVLGLFNLIPLLPLDGGMVVSAGLDRLLPRRGAHLYLWVSLVVTAAATVVLFAEPGFRLLAPFALLLLALQVVQLGQQARRRAAQSRSRPPSVPSSAAGAILVQLLAQGELQQVATLGASLFARERDPAVAILVARAAARLGEHQTAMAWLQAAADAGDPAEAVWALEHDADLAPLRADPAARALRVALGAG